MRAMDSPIALVGVPTALGGILPGDRHLGMAEAPSDLRRLGFVEALRSRGLPVRDDGDLPI